MTAAQKALTLAALTAALSAQLRVAMLADLMELPTAG
jgi:hypothetical protein